MVQTMVRLRWLLLPVLVACLYKVMWVDDSALRFKRNLHSYSYTLADNAILLEGDDSPFYVHGVLDDRDMYDGLYPGAYGKEAESMDLFATSNGMSSDDVPQSVLVGDYGGSEVSANETVADNSTSSSITNLMQEEEFGASRTEVKCEDDSSTFNQDYSCGIKLGATGTLNSNRKADDLNVETEVNDMLGGSHRQNSELDGRETEEVNITSSNVGSDGGNATGTVNENTDVSGGVGKGNIEEKEGLSEITVVTYDVPSNGDISQVNSDEDKTDNESAVDSVLGNNATRTDTGDEVEDLLSNSPPIIETTNGTPEVNNKEEIIDNWQALDDAGGISNSTPYQQESGNMEITGATQGDEEKTASVESATEATSQGGVDGNTPGEEALAANEASIKDQNNDISGIPANDQQSAGGSLGEQKQDLGEANEEQGNVENDKEQDEVEETSFAGTVSDQLPSEVLQENYGKETNHSDQLPSEVLQENYGKETNHSELTGDKASAGITDREVQNEGGVGASEQSGKPKGVSEEGDGTVGVTGVNEEVSDSAKSPGDVSRPGEQQSTEQSVNYQAEQEPGTSLNQSFSDTTADEAPSDGMVSDQSEKDDDTHVGNPEESEKGAGEQEITAMKDDDTHVGNPEESEKVAGEQEITALKDDDTHVGNPEESEKVAGEQEITAMIDDDTHVGNPEEGEKAPGEQEIAALIDDATHVGNPEESEKVAGEQEITALKDDDTHVGNPEESEKVAGEQEITALKDDDTHVGNPEESEKVAGEQEITALKDDDTHVGNPEESEKVAGEQEITALKDDDTHVGNPEESEKGAGEQEITALKDDDTHVGNPEESEKVAGEQEITAMKDDDTHVGNPEESEKGAGEQEITAMKDDDTHVGNPEESEKVAGEQEITAMKDDDTHVGNPEESEKVAGEQEITAMKDDDTHVGNPEESEKGAGEQEITALKDDDTHVGNPEESEKVAGEQEITAMKDDDTHVGNPEESEKGAGEQEITALKDDDTHVGNPEESNINQVPGNEVQTEGPAGTNGGWDKESIPNMDKPTIVGNIEESSPSQVPGDSELQNDGTLEEGKTAGITEEESNAPTRVSLDLPVEDTAGEESPSMSEDRGNAANNIRPETATSEVAENVDEKPEVTILNTAEDSARDIETIQSEGSQQGETEGEISENSGNPQQNVSEAGGRVTSDDVTGVGEEKTGKLTQAAGEGEDVEIVNVGGNSAGTSGVSGKLVNAVSTQSDNNRLPAQLVYIVKEYLRRAAANRRNANADHVTDNLNVDRVNGLTGAEAMDYGVQYKSDDISSNVINTDYNECCPCVEDDCSECDLPVSIDYAGLPPHYPHCPLCQEEFYSLLVSQHNPQPVIDYSQGRICKRHRNSKYKQNKMGKDYKKHLPYIRKALSNQDSHVYQQEVFKPVDYDKKGRKSMEHRPLPFIIERYFSIYGKSKPSSHKSVKMLYYNQKNGNRPKVYKLDRLQNT